MQLSSWSLFLLISRVHSISAYKNLPWSIYSFVVGRRHPLIVFNLKRQLSPSSPACQTNQAASLISLIGLWVCGLWSKVLGWAAGWCKPDTLTSAEWFPLYVPCAQPTLLSLLEGSIWKFFHYVQSASSRGQEITCLKVWKENSGKCVKREFWEMLEHSSHTWSFYSDRISGGLKF